jgi:hypothetical protein
MDTDSLGESFRKSLQNKINDINIDFSEAILDTVISDELLKEIPIIKSIVTVAQIGISIKNQFLFKKLLKFLFELNSIPIEERQKFIDKLDNNNFSKSIYDNLLIVIDRLDNDEKAQIMGKLLKALIYEKIELDMFFRLINILEKVFINDLRILNGHFNDKSNDETRIDNLYKLDDIVKINLANNGLMIPIYGDNSYNAKYTGSSEKKVFIKDYRISNLGELLIENGF